MSNANCSGGEDQRNLVVVIEHNLDGIKPADYILDIGPVGGVGGVLAPGTPEQVVEEPRGFTGRYLKTMLDG